MKPRRREEGLFVQQLGDELVIFDHASYKASTLNASAAFVFNLCDGTRTSEMLAEEVSAKQERRIRRGGSDRRSCPGSL